MSNIKKLMMSAAGGAGLDVDEVFSTYLYTGTGANPRTITNNFDVATEGGLIWLKPRSASGNHSAYDTERGVSSVILPNENQQEVSLSGYGITSFNTDGFTTGLNMTDENINNKDYVAWSFRQAPKFFDVVTYTGAGALQSISHNLGSVPGCIIIKCTSTGSTNWMVYHRGEGANRFGYLNEQNSFFTNTGVWQNTTPTASAFYLGTGDSINGSGKTYVAYLFAHNDGDGGFGPDGDQDIIKCGSYTTTGTGVGSVDLGFEPQWILVRASEITNNWLMADTMRGWSSPTSSTQGTLQYLHAQSSGAESDTYLVDPTATGFDYRGSGSNRKYIYMAIRRGSLFPPESGTEVFDMHTGSAYNTVFSTSLSAVDLAITKSITGTGPWYTGARLQGGFYNVTNDGAAETGAHMEHGLFDLSYAYAQKQGDTSFFTWMWKRAPGFFDVVAYTGNGTAGRTVSHNLGVAPEMIWAKGRDIAQNWAVYNPNGRLQLLNQSGAEYSAAVTDDFYGNGSSVIAPTATEFTIGSASSINNSNNTYIAYLFATLPGISKVGSYTGTTASQVINCGFTAGARLVIIKSTDANANWFILDTERGITTTSNDGVLYLSATQQQYTEAFAIGYDVIQPHSSGFKLVANDNNLNKNNGNYIFYAVA